MWSGNDRGGLGPTTGEPVFDLYKNNSKLTPEQMIWLNSRLTPRERTEIQSLASSSLYEVNLSRGLPCAFATIAGLFLLKKRRIVNWSPITSGLIFGTHSRNEATGGRPKDRGRLTYAQIREAHRSGRPIELLQEHPSEDKLLGEERNQDLLYGDKKEQTYVKPNMPSYFGSDAPSDSYMSGTPRGLNEESGDYGASNERWK
ncbi:unnamed protein product [Meloidogyne enterolobii]|uniref:Uncharacterized protein n=1 Tax=Meloidogyne enterolobii TaxID=390850 RepID=A0ACB1AN43_MELEN